MPACKVMIKSTLDEARSRLQAYGEKLEFSQRGEWALAEDSSGTELFGWEPSVWRKLAADRDLIYAYYDEEMNAEFIHIKDGRCLRAYQEDSGEVDTDEGTDPESAISDWADVADYIDDHMQTP